MRSSTSVRSRRTSPTRSSAGRRASGGMLPRSCSSSEASATSAVSGVRSSWATSATNWRFCCREVSRRATVASSESAIRLNSAAHRPTSSRPRSGTRAERSPPAMRRAARPASATGRRSQRAMIQATSSAMRDRHRPTRQQPRPELGEGRLDGVRREHEEQVRAVRPGGHRPRGPVRPPGPATRSPALRRSRWSAARARLPRATPRGRAAHRASRRRSRPAPGRSPAARRPWGVHWPRTCGRRRARVRAGEQHGQVVVHLLARVGDQPGAQRGIDERVHPEADRGHRDRHERHQGERDPGADADGHGSCLRRPAGGPCSPRRAP